MFASLNPNSTIENIEEHGMRALTPSIGQTKVHVVHTGHLMIAAKHTLVVKHCHWTWMDWPETKWTRKCRTKDYMNNIVCAHWIRHTTGNTIKRSTERSVDIDSTDWRSYHDLGSIPENHCSQLKKCGGKRFCKNLGECQIWVRVRGPG